MSIEKKSLISTLKTTKKANLASTPAVSEGSTTRKGLVTPRKGLVTPKKGLATPKKGLATPKKAKMYQ
jgi:hypothetical protein